jgi:hypothetical protein
MIASGQKGRDGRGLKTKSKENLMTTENNKTTKKPAFIAYHVRNKDGQDEAFWTRVGVAFPNADGKGMNILLDVIPLDGRITLRVPSEKPLESE